MHHGTPLQVRLTNTDTNYEFKAQSAGLYFNDITSGYEKAAFTPTALNFYNTGTSNPIVQIYTGVDGSGAVMCWSATYGKWLSLLNLESRVQNLEARI